MLAAMDWSCYDQQEGSEPFDALSKAKGSLAQADQARYDQEQGIQSYLRMVKMNSDSAKSPQEWLCNFVDNTSVPNASYCRARLECRISPLLRWHYYLALYFAERGGWLAKAIPLILGSAEQVGGLRSSSYLLLAHNLNRWYNCKKDTLVLEQALQHIRGRKSDRYAHWYAKVVADLKPCPKVRDEVRDLLIEIAGKVEPEMASQYLEAAIFVARDKTPAKAAWSKIHEQHADAQEDSTMKIAYYNEAKRHIDGNKNHRRINGKIKETQKYVKLTEITHKYKIPRLDVHGQSGFGRVQYLVNLFWTLILKVGAAQMLEEDLREKFPLQQLFTRIEITNDGIPGPRPDILNEKREGVDHIEQLSRMIQIISAIFSANVREYEKDGRISEDSYTSYLDSFGLHADASQRLIAVGLKSHFSGDYISAVHILLPQVEQTLRLLLEQKGLRMLGGNYNVRQDLLKPMIRNGSRILGKDLAEFLRIWLIDEGSINFRNRVCHGLYGDYQKMKGYDPLQEFGHGMSLMLILVICLLTGMSVYVG